MSGVDTALAEIVEEIGAFGPGTSRAPATGTAEFFRLRALVIGHAYLLRVKALGLENDPASSERLYRAAAGQFSKTIVPPAPEVPVEVMTEAQKAQVAEAISSGNL